MTPTRLTLLSYLTICVLAITACDSQSAPAPAELEHWVYTSARAPYRVKMPTDWETLDAKGLENGADFAAHHDGAFVMVLPVEIPAELGRNLPTLDAFREAGVAQMAQDIPKFDVLETRPIRLGEAMGQRVEADAEVDGHAMRYIITYVQHQGWRYQIVGWARRTAAKKLGEEVDHILAHFDPNAAQTLRQSNSSSNNAGHSGDGE